MGTVFYQVEWLVCECPNDAYCAQYSKQCPIGHLALWTNGIRLTYNCVLLAIGKRSIGFFVCPLSSITRPNQTRMQLLLGHFAWVTVGQNELNRKQERETKGSPDRLKAVSSLRHTSVHHTHNFSSIYSQ